MATSQATEVRQNRRRSVVVFSLFDSQQSLQSNPKKSDAQAQQSPRASAHAMHAVPKLPAQTTAHPAIAAAHSIPLKSEQLHGLKPTGVNDTSDLVEKKRFTAVSLATAAASILVTT
jgi:hypothetical protein